MNPATIAVAAVALVAVVWAGILNWQLDGVRDDEIAASARADAAVDLAEARAREVAARSDEIDQLRLALRRADRRARDERTRADELAALVTTIKEHPDANDPLHPLLRDLDGLRDTTRARGDRDRNADPDAGGAPASAPK